MIKIYSLLDEKSGKFLKVLDGKGLHLTDNIYEAIQFKTSYESIKKDCDSFNVTCEDYKQSKFYNITGEYLFKPVLIEFTYKTKDKNLITTIHSLVKKVYDILKLIKRSF